MRFGCCFSHHRAYILYKDRGTVNNSNDINLRYFLEDWRYRHAGLMAISAVGEGCHKVMEEVLGQIVEAILPFFQDAVSVKLP